jgi:uncharacterized membrane protein (UPF0127 family)
MRTITALGPPDLTPWVVEVPEGSRERRRGLSQRDGLKRNHAMLFFRCRSVHTFGMTFPILVVGLDRELRVERVWVVCPRRLILPRAGVRHILECAIDSDVAVGDRFRSELMRGLSAAGGKRPAALRPSRR